MPLCSFITAMMMASLAAHGLMRFGKLAQMLRVVCSLVVSSAFWRVRHSLVRHDDSL